MVRYSGFFYRYKSDIRFYKKLKNISTYVVNPPGMYSEKYGKYKIHRPFVLKRIQKIRQSRESRDRWIWSKIFELSGLVGCIKASYFNSHYLPRLRKIAHELDRQLFYIQNSKKLAHFLDKNADLFRPNRSFLPNSQDQIDRIYEQLRCSKNHFNIFLRPHKLINQIIRENLPR